MQSIEQTKAIIKPLEPISIKVSEKKAPYYIGVPELPPINHEVKKLYNLNHTQSNYYYKAHTLRYDFKNIYVYDEKTTDPETFITSYSNEKLTNRYMIIGVSYETPITILDDKTGVLLINKDYYNSSKTTKEHYNTFINRNKNGICYKYFLNDSSFNIMLKYLNNNQLKTFDEKIQYIKHAAEYEKPIFNILLNQELDKKERINTFLDAIGFNKNTITRYLKKEIKYINQYSDRPDFIQSHKVQELKTRNKHEIIIYKNRIKIALKFAARKQSKTVISNIKFEILEDDYLTQDLRNNNEKLLFNGYDIGVTNTKELKKQTFKKSKCLYYGF